MPGSLNRNNALRYDGQNHATGDMIPMDEIIQAIFNATQDAIKVELASGAATGASVTVVPATPAAGNKATFVRGLKAPAAIGTPEALAAAGTYVQSVVIYARRAARVANVGSVWIDSLGTNDGQLIELTPGAFIAFEAPPGKYIDLADIFVDSVTLTDGVYYIGLV